MPKAAQGCQSRTRFFALRGLGQGYIESILKEYEGLESRVFWASMEESDRSFLVRRETMASESILWETSWERALQRARQEKKPVLLDFFNPG